MNGAKFAEEIREGICMGKKGTKVLCGFLTASMVFSQNVAVGYAVNKEHITLTSKNANKEKNQTESKKQSGVIGWLKQVWQGNTEKTSQSAAKTLVIGEREKVSAKGSMEVRLSVASDIETEQKFTISLNDNIKEVTVDRFSQNSVIFDDLEAGTYQLKITSPGYADYAQSVEVKNYRYRVQVTPDIADADKELDNAHSGAMIYGDFNSDGKISKEDAVKVVDELEKEEKNLLYDSNRDGKVDLLDLQKAASVIGRENVESTVESLIPAEVIVGNVGESTILISGEVKDVKDVLEGNAIQLQTLSGKTIEESPIEFSFDFSSETPMEMGGFTVQTPSDNAIQDGVITVQYEEDGKMKDMEISISSALSRILSRSGAKASVDSTGKMTVHLNGQIAVKKVTIKITATTKPNASLMEISKVEFLNNMENRIPEPEMNIPEWVDVKAGSKRITLEWKKVKNVTGYEVSISCDGETEYVRTTETTLTITNFLNQKLENKKEYTVCVQSVNGDWKSGFGEIRKVTPKADEKPDAPDSLTLKAEYRSITASWKEPKDDTADTYTIYYKKKTDNDYKKISDIAETSYRLENLEDEAEYEVYVTASNEYGEGPASLTASAKTITATNAVLSEYRLINKSNGEGELSAHIKEAKIQNGSMVGSTLDKTEGTALGLFDNDCKSYWNVKSWDAGGYNQNKNNAITVTFDKEYTIGEIQFAESKNLESYPYIRIYYQDENGKDQVMFYEWNTLTVTGENGRDSYRLKLSKPITVQSLSIGFGRYITTSPEIQIAEIRFYEYDSLEDEIQALYTDDLHLSVRDDVTEKELDELQTRLNTKVDGEYHPDKKTLQIELDAARTLLKEQTKLEDVIFIRSEISPKYDSKLKTSGLNAWQPLGVSAKAEETIVIYVGKEGASTGSNTELQLVATQQHAESTNLSKVVTNLKVGRNEVTIPTLTSTDVEKGGSLYIQYTGNRAEDNYAVRVTGGVKTPVLNLYKVTDESERQSLIEAYIKELQTYVAGLDKTADEKLSVANVTDIMTDHMMFSIPASQVLSALGSSNQAEKLEDTAKAIDELLVLFYQHKGLTNSFAEGTSQSVIESNRLPSQHLNIRYMKMFSGAFMYAAGNHVGVEWEQTKGLILEKKPEVSSEGRLIDGNYFGWGIAHEIGHQINQSEYTVAEVTNNYFALLAQADGTNESVRFKYDDVYKKVTSNAVGYPSDVFVQLAMYWQLHLAYDNDYAQKTYDTYDEIFENLIFARMDSYARNTSLFEGSVSLKLTDSVDQNLMRLSSAAANKNLTEFFTRWGLVPDSETAKFMNQFEEESRAIYYINDDAKTDVIKNQTSSFKEKSVIENVSVNVDGSEVTLKIAPESSQKSNILGYEIVRVTTRKGQQEKEVIGFTTTNTFADTVSGSRVVSYEIYAIDKNTNRSKVYCTDSKKVISDGSYEKDQFTVSTNMTSKMDKEIDATEQMPCEPTKKLAVTMVIDGDKSEEYVGSSSSEPYILIDLKQQLEVSALRYTAESSAMKEYRVEVSKNGTDYKTVKEGEFDLTNNQEIIYFVDDSNSWVATYDAQYIKITAVGQKNTEISIAEIDILGPSGDNIEWIIEDDTPAIGILTEDYICQQSIDDRKELKVASGSAIFTGQYKGNPAYNVLVLYDEDGQIVGGMNGDELVAQQIILADVPEDAMLGEVFEGTWIYWIEPEHFKKEELPSKVRAELYRVDNALTNEGERFVSDTIFYDVPKELPEIELD